MTGALWKSALVASLFALHPLNVETVAWVSERKNVLSTFFWLLTMWAYIDYVKKKRIKNYLLVILFLALGLMSKPMLVTLPFVLLLLDFWPLNRFNGEIPTLNEIKLVILEKIPLFLLIIGSSVITYITQKSGGAMLSLKNITVNKKIISIEFDDRISNALVSYFEYLEKMIWPSGLAPFYTHPLNTIPIWKPILFGVVLLGFTFFTIKEIWRRPYLAVGWFWYLGTLVPVIGVVQVGAQAMADRYAYIPLIGIFIAIAWGIGDLKKNAEQFLLPALTPIIALVLAVLTSHQLSHWTTVVTLMKRNLQIAKDADADLFYSYYHLAVAFDLENRLSEAIINYKMAAKLRPNYVSTQRRLGLLFSEMKDFNQAILHFKEAIRIKPEWPTSYSNLGNALAQKGELEKAIPYYKKALKIKPRYATAHMNLGNTLAQLEKLDEAITHYRKAIRLAPDNPMPYTNLGNALASMGKLEEAKSYHKIAFKLRNQESIKP